MEKPIEIKFKFEWTIAQKQALKSLTNTSQIAKKPSDKGGNIVPMHSNQYVNTREVILSNDEWYRQIAKSFIEKVCERFKSIIYEAFSNRAG